MLLDDELPGLTYLKMLCEQIEGLNVVKAFNSSEVFVRDMQNLDFDLCILDIEMPGLNGLQVARLLKDKAIIFTTAYKEYAIDAFDVDAVDYLVKPIKKERLEIAIEKAATRLASKREENKFLQLNTDKGKALIKVDELYYIKVSDTDSRDKEAFLTDNRRLTLKNISFEHLLEVLPSHHFCRVNKREIIALKAVAHFSSDQITTTLTNKSGEQIKLSLSEIYKNNFANMLGN